MIVVSDTTPLISLMKVNLLSVLQKLFEEVMIPNAVYEELTCNTLFQNEAKTINESSYIRIVSVEELKSVRILQRTAGLDRGESEAIIYADEHQADFLLMDEAAGRRAAKALGLRVMGTIGILLNAFDDNILTEKDITNVLNILKSSNRRISEHLIQDALNYMRNKSI